MHGTVSRAIELTKSETQTSEEDHPSSTVMSQETCFEAQHDYSEEEEINQQNDETSCDCAVEEEASNQNYAESSYEEMVEENYDENNYDWISEISRPRSYWEEQRQAWYREILDTGSPNEDIQVLLQRYKFCYLNFSIIIRLKIGCLLKKMVLYILNTDLNTIMFAEEQFQHSYPVASVKQWIG